MIATKKCKNALIISDDTLLEASKKLAYNYCKRMYARSGLDLYRQLMHGDNLDYSLEDMSQDIALAIIMDCRCLHDEEDNTHGYIINKSNYKDVMRTVNSRVYRLKRNSSHKSLYIDIDGEEVCITDALGMINALDEDTRWYALMLYDSMVDGLSTSIYSKGLVNADALKIYGYQRIIEGRPIKDCNYSYCDQWIKRHRDLFDL